MHGGTCTRKHKFYKSVYKLASAPRWWCPQYQSFAAMLGVHGISIHTEKAVSHSAFMKKEINQWMQQYQSMDLSDRKQSVAHIDEIPHSSF
jgi:hypothetical protein